MKKFIQILFSLIIIAFCTNFAFAATTTEASKYTMLQTPVVVVDNPSAYLDKNIQFVAKFNKFSVLGLDYEGALRSSQIYIGILINRDDVGNNIIPLSEFKMFIKRADAEKLTDLEAGDTIMIKGKVFAVALGDPWLDINELKIITPKNKKTTKTGK